MPRTMPAGLAAHLAGLSACFRADLWTLTTLDATVYRWTSCEKDVVTGGNTFLSGGTANAPLVRRGPYRQNFLPTIDTLDLTLIGGAFTISGKALPLQAALGYFDGARVQLDHLVGQDLPTALSFGPIVKFFEGRVATMRPQGPVVLLQIRSEADALNQLLPQFLFQPACGNAVYDANCGLTRATFTITGTASGVPTTTTVPTATAGLTAKPAGYFDLGVLSFTSGALNGVRAAIQGWASNTFTLALPLTSAPAAGDGLSVYPGCPRTKVSCGPIETPGVVSSGSTATQVKSTTAAIIALANGYFVGAFLTMTSGAQNGQTRQITGFTVSAGVATLTVLSLPGAPATSDTFTAAPGGKFNNWIAFRGYPHVPSPESAGM